MVLWMGIIFSPFVAFFVNGRVDDSNWAPAIVTALACFTGLVLISMRTAHSYRQLPASIRAEYQNGRLMPPLPAGGAEPGSIGFGPLGTDDPLAGLTPKGVWFAPYAICGASWSQSWKMMDINVKAGMAGGSKMPCHFLDWAELVEWQVCDDSDGEDYYRLVLRDRGHVDLKRPASPTEEPPILDYVRKVGVRPVRLFADVDT